MLARVVEQLGDLELVTSHEIEGLFAVDLAFLQDFYGVINFGNQEEYEALLRSQRDTPLLGQRPAAVGSPASAAARSGGGRHRATAATATCGCSAAPRPALRRGRRGDPASGAVGDRP